MAHDNRVVWNEGMFLRVQHFQQADRWTESIVARTARMLVAHGWGVSTLLINQPLLGNGRFGVTEVSGLLPDGTPFDAPGMVELPVPLELAEGEKNKIVYLTLPTFQSGNAEIGNGQADSRSLRYTLQPEEVSDTNLGSAIAVPIDVARLRLQFKLEGDDLSGLERIPVARIVEVRQDSSIVLDDRFIPTALNCAASGVLESMASEILGVVGHRAEAIADRMGDPSIRGTAEISDFQFLQVLNRYDTILQHKHQNLSSLHPETLYSLLIQIAGEISTFTKERRRAEAFPGYRHVDLQGSFEPVMADLRRSLSAVLERSAVEIPLEERRHGIRVGIVSDGGLLGSANFVLAARAETPQEQLRSQLPRQIKVGPVEEIADLVNIALPGIGVTPTPVAPRQLPYRPGTTYFELDRGDKLWKKLTTTGGIAVHVSGDFPALELELWAIKA